MANEDFDILKQVLRREEESRSKAYDDATGRTLVVGTMLNGHPTIGTGRELILHGISAEEDDFLLMNDMKGVTAQAIHAFPWFASLDPIRRVIICSMIFQMGLGELLQWPQFLQKMAAKDYSGAADAGLDSLWARRQSPSRARREMATLRSGYMVTR